VTMTVQNESTDERKGDENHVDKKAAADNSINSNIWGSDMYPERRGGKIHSSWFKSLIGFAGRESIDKNRCEDNVYRCIKDSKLLI